MNFSFFFFYLGYYIYALLIIRQYFCLNYHQFLLRHHKNDVWPVTIVKVVGITYDCDQAKGREHEPMCPKGKLKLRSPLQPRRGQTIAWESSVQSCRKDINC
jgi:hypothetical protein